MPDTSAQLTQPEHLRPIWTLIADGARRTGHVTEGGHDTAMCIAQNALAALNNNGYVVVPDEPDHVLDLRDDGWTLQHSMSCRLAGALFDCELNRAVVTAFAAGPPVERGRWVVALDDTLDDGFALVRQVDQATRS